MNWIKCVSKNRTVFLSGILYSIINNVLHLCLFQERTPQSRGKLKLSYLFYVLYKLSHHVYLPVFTILTLVRKLASHNKQKQLGETNQNRRNKRVTELAFVRRVINLVPRLQPRSQGLSSSRPLE